MARFFRNECVCNDGQALNIDALYRAARCADECAALGLTTPTVLAVGQYVERAKPRCRVDRQGTYTDPDRFIKLRSLWKVIDKRTTEFESKLKRTEVKAERNPNAYRCAASGCGIEATSKTGLMRCAGACPVDDKPAYCSKECQRQVRYACLFYCHKKPTAF